MICGILGRSYSAKPCIGKVKAVFTLRVSRQVHHRFEFSGASRPTEKNADEQLLEDSKDVPPKSGWYHQGLGLGIALALGLGGAIASSNQGAWAQNITTDGTLGPAQTLTGPTYNIVPGLGQTVGSNLFHSFLIFNLTQGEIANFRSGSGINNILARVTGGNASLIDGQMFTSSPDVNLFFINPYGIIFGPNASLDVGGRTGRGAFVATTVDAISWPNGGQFSATNPGDANSLLTLVGDPGGFLSSARAPSPLSIVRSKLEVYDNQSLILLGGNVTIDGGELIARGGRVEIGAVGGAGEITLDPQSTGAVLGFPDDVVRADVTLANGTQINAITGQDNGTGTSLIRILGRNIAVTNGSQLDTSTEGVPNAGIVAFNATDTVLITGQDTNIFSNVRAGATGNAGGIGIRARSFFLTDRAQLTTSTFGLGNSGVVLVQADQVAIDNSLIFSTVEQGAEGQALGISIEANSISLTNNTELQTITRGNGDAGQVILETNGGSVSLDNSNIFSTVEEGGVGNGGRIDIKTGSLSLNNGGQLQTLVREGGTGDPGIIFVEASNSVSMAGISPTTGNPSGIFSIIAEGAQGGFGSNQFAGGIFDAILGRGGGDIVGAIGIETGSLSLTDGAVISTSTGGDGNAGAVIIIARDKISINGSGILSTAEERAQGDSGAVLIGARDIVIEGTPDNRSGVTTQTDGQGDAGLIYVETERDISVRGERSGFFSTVEGQGTGTSGAILIDTRSLFLRDGAQVSVNNQQNGEAGGIGIRAREDIFLLRRGEISATTLSGEGGDIELEVGDFVVLLGNSNISTTAGLAPGGGNGGNITINTEAPRATGIWGLPVNDSNITAQAYEGDGGSIRINSRRLYSIDRRDLDVPPTNDITVSSTFGREGQLEINDVDIDPTQGLNNLPQTPIDPSSLIAQRCPIRGESGEEVNKFTVTGRGGMPSNPNDTLQNESVNTPWVTPNPTQDNNTPQDSSAQPEPIVPSTPRTSQKPVLVEAQGWMYGSKGEIILTAQTSTATPNSPSLLPAASCNGN
jgi:filamentous hemagglutinin family protein